VCYFTEWALQALDELEGAQARITNPRLSRIVLEHSGVFRGEGVTTTMRWKATLVRLRTCPIGKPLLRAACRRGLRTR
jgi:hypothetical protein